MYFRLLILGRHKSTSYFCVGDNESGADVGEGEVAHQAVEGHRAQRYEQASSLVVHFISSVIWEFLRNVTLSKQNEQTNSDCMQYRTPRLLIFLRRLRFFSALSDAAASASKSRLGMHNRLKPINCSTTYMPLISRK